MSTGPSPAERRQRVLNQFKQWAPAYDATEYVRVAAARLVELAQLCKGECVLDLATGTGLAALPAAEAVGSTGQVIGTDISLNMLEQARGKIAATGLTNIQVREGDAAQPDFADRSFDVVLCASAIFFLPDQLSAVREWRRVLRPGGRVIFSCWGQEFGQPLRDLFRARIQKFGISLPEADRRLQRPDQCEALMREVGFVDIEVSAEQHGYNFASVAAYWEELVGRSEPLSRLPLEELARFQAEHLSEVSALATERGIWWDVPTNFAMGRKP